MGDDHARRVTQEILSSLGIIGTVRFFFGVWIVRIGLVIGGHPVTSLTVELVAEALKETGELSGSES